MPARSLPYAAQIEGAGPPFNTLHLRVFYPTRPTGDERELETGQLAVDEASAPLPIVIFLPGVNCPAETYYWLAHGLAARGVAVVLYNWVAENIPGRISYTPGLSRAALTPENYGKEISAAALPAILNALTQLNANSVLAGKLNLERLVLGGHSAGGMLALMNANPALLPQVVGAFSYCSSPFPTLMFGGWPKGEMPPLPSATPLLMLGATEDGIGDLHNRSIGLPEQSGAQTIQTAFEQMVTSTRGDAYFGIVRGANHHTLCHPRDDTVGRTFADLPAVGDEAALREKLLLVIGYFVEAVALSKDETHSALESELNHSTDFAITQHK
jgi:predicted dienelactone hydrolase